LLIRTQAEATLFRKVISAKMVQAQADTRVNLADTRNKADSQSDLQIDYDFLDTIQ